MQDEELTGKIIGCAMKVHSTLGHGFLESVYHNALEYELRKSGIETKCKHPIEVIYDGVAVGNFEADLLVADRVIIEIKATQSLAPAHEVQLVNYLTATGIEIGLLINFGSLKLEFKRKHKTYQPKRNTSVQTE